MDLELQRRMQQLFQMSKDGLFGDAARQNAEAFEQTRGTNMDVLVTIANDFDNDRSRKSAEELANLTDLFCQLFIIVYREVKKADQAVADGFLNAFHRDYPGTTGTAVYPQCEALLQAAFGLKMSARDPLQLWQHSLRVFETYNEFINALLGFYIVAWRTVLGKRINVNVFHNTYGSKLHEFSELTNGNDGIFYLFFRLAHVPIRNAIAHGNIWLDRDTNKVRYAEAKGAPTTEEMDCAEFMLRGTIGSHLPLAYMAAAAVVGVMEAGTVKDIAKLPPRLVTAYRFKPKTPLR